MSSQITPDEQRRLDQAANDREDARLPENPPPLVRQNAVVPHEEDPNDDDEMSVGTANTEIAGRKFRKQKKRSSRSKTEKPKKSRKGRKGQKGRSSRSKTKKSRKGVR